MPSSAYKAILADPTATRDYAAAITIYGSPNVTLDDANILSGSMTYSESTAHRREIALGTTVMSEFKVTLLNLAGELDNVNLQNSTMLAQVGLMVGASREWVSLGQFVIVEAKKGLKTIAIRAYDRMVLTERPYSDANIVFPCSVATAVNAICLACGITTTGITGTNSGLILQGIPEGSRMTCRDALGYLATLCGKIARFSRLGVLEFIWYGQTPSATITPALRDGLEYDPEPISVTGVEYVAIDEDYGQTTYRAGTNDYCLALADNPFMFGQNVQFVINGIWADIGASSYYIFDCKLQGDPSFISADALSVVLPDSTTINTNIMTHLYTYRGHSRLSADGKTAALSKYKPAAEKQMSSVVQSEAIANQRLTAYQLAMRQLNAFAAESVGLHATEEVLPDGSIIYYKHDALALEDSTYIWRQSATAFTYSADGGTTWNGYDVTGNMLVNILNVIGINAEWINTGTLDASKVLVKNFGAGRNLLSNTRLLTGLNPDATKYKGFNSVSKTYVAGGGIQEVYSRITTVGMDESENYVLSFFAKSTTSNNIIRCYFFEPNTVTSAVSSTGQTSTTADGNCQVTIGTAWQRYWIRYKQTKTSSTKAVIIGRMTMAGTVSIAGPKLEVGSVPTDWSPAPEDTETGGFTKIDGGNVTTGRVQSADGLAYFDLDGREIKMQGLINGKIATATMGPTKPFELAMADEAGILQPLIYITGANGFSGPGKLVTSRYDINEDGIVDYRDIRLMVDYVLHNPGTYPPLSKMDLNGDGRVNSTDLTIWAQNAQYQNNVGDSGGRITGIDQTGLWVSNDWYATRKYVSRFAMGTTATVAKTVIFSLPAIARDTAYLLSITLSTLGITLPARPDVALLDVSSSAGFICNYYFDGSTAEVLKFRVLKCDGAIAAGTYRFSLVVYA